jgi:mono/diheme cytochrome c family protein
MKLIIAISVLVSAATSFQQCATQQKAIEYEIPDHVTKENKRLFIEKCEKGKVLYKIHCGGCHGIFTKGKDDVPNFTKTQIDSYHAAALIGIDPKNHAVAKKMSSDQIDQIITFLRLRKIDQ